ncbi:type III secretion system export apparatus subunit SctS [Enterobacter cloacae]|uniref:type III secretion system export apparatus subunit SctS n=1 Tax=Enterobacter cloacae TaxID=550 RepID=UPI002FF7A5DB
MNNVMFISNSALIVVLKFSAVPVTFATIVGIVVGLFQTVMQIQEQTLPFGLKMLAVFASIFMLMEWFSAEMMSFAIQTFTLAFR